MRRKGFGKERGNRSNKKNMNNVLAKCKFCGRRFMTTEGGELRGDGMLVSRCAHCKKVYAEEIYKRLT